MSSTVTDNHEPTELTFEDGYQRLQGISTRLNEDEVPVSEMCDLFAEGKGLEIALTEFLDTQRARVEDIERGEGIRAFRITRTPAATATSASDSDEPGDLRDEDFLVDFEPTPAPPTAQDDDTPF